MTYDLAYTTSAEGKPIRGGYSIPVNVANGGVSCTLNTRYDGLSEITDIVTLAHFPKMVVLMEYMM